MISRSIQNISLKLDDIGPEHLHIVHLVLMKQHNYDSSYFNHKDWEKNRKRIKQSRPIAAGMLSLGLAATART